MALLVAGACFAAPAQADGPSDLRNLLLNGAFGNAADWPAANLDAKPSALELFDRGLAAFGLKDFGEAAAFFGEVAQQPKDPALAVRAAVVASLALSNSGDRDNACQYTAVIEPLVVDMPLLWRGWVEETRRFNSCD
jgi:hypothetical protein